MTTNPGMIGLDLLDDAPYGAYAVDPDQTIWYWNPAAERILGHHAADAIGQLCHQVVQNLVGAENEPVCLEGCPSLVAVREGKIPPVYSAWMLCASGQRKLVTLIPLVIGSLDGEDAVLVHLFTEPELWRDPAQVAMTVGTALSTKPFSGGLLTGSEDDRITPRELEVLRRVAAGLTQQEIATDLVISYHTVRNHTASLRRKLGANSTLALIQRARVLRLI